MNEEIGKEFSADEKTYLVVSSAEKLHENIDEIVNFFVKEQNKVCIYVCINKPCETIKTDLIKERKLNEKKFYFIDCISKAVSQPVEEANSLFVQNPSDLTGISVAIKQLSQLAGDDGVIVFDSLRTLLIYNKVEKISAFVRSINSIAAKYEVKVVFMTTTSKEKILLNKITNFIDKEIELE